MTDRDIETKGSEDEKMDDIDSKATEAVEETEQVAEETAAEEAANGSAAEDEGMGEGAGEAPHTMVESIERTIEEAEKIYTEATEFEGEDPEVPGVGIPEAMSVHFDEDMVPDGGSVADDAADDEDTEAADDFDVAEGDDAKDTADDAPIAEVELLDEDAKKKGISTPIAAALAVACGLGGFAVAKAVPAGSPATAEMAKAGEPLEGAALDTVVGQVTFDGKTQSITAKQAIMLNSTMSDGKGEYPTADMVIATARDIIISADAEKRGIKTDDEAIKEFAKSMLGSDDYEELAGQYSIDVESLKALVKSSYVSQEVRKQVVGENEPTLASPPAEPKEGEEDKATREYYDYIIKSAGDEWNAKEEKWVEEEGDFAVMFKESKTFKPQSKTASYNDALQAYQVLGSRYSAEMSTYDTQWNDYMKDLLAGASVSVYSLIS